MNSLETRAVLTEIFVLCWNLPSGTKHRRWLHCFPWRHKQFCRWFCANLDETKAGMVQFMVPKDIELEIDCLTSRRLLQKICCYKFQFCTKVWASSKAGLSSSYDGWAKCKEKVPDVSDPNQNVETTCNSKLKFAELKDLFIKRVQKN